MKKKVRLSLEEIKIIKDIIKKYDENAKVILFGSRVDLNKKGGDIDLLIISKKIDLKKILDIKADFFIYFGDRKIDLIVTDNIEQNSFYKFAFQSGVEL